MCTGTNTKLATDDDQNKKDDSVHQENASLHLQGSENPPYKYKDVDAQESEDMQDHINKGIDPEIKEIDN